MGKKGEKTKALILRESYDIFVQKGYKDVTMKDICEKTGLSRGGLYRHYESVFQIFSEILDSFLTRQNNEFSRKMEQGISAVKILDEILERYEYEIIDFENCLSTALFEFYSLYQGEAENNPVLVQYKESERMWTDLIRYGIERKEFKKADPEAVYSVILFSYQGIRMYSKLMPVDKRMASGLIRQVRGLLVSESNE